MSLLRLVLGVISNKAKDIDHALNDIMQEAVEKRIALLEIIPR